MTSVVSAVAAKAASAVGKLRLAKPDRLAEHMAEGCPSVGEAAYRMRLTAAEADRIWKGIVKTLGWQAR